MLEQYQLAIADNATGSPQLVTLTGTGVNEATTVQFIPSSLVFTAQTLNTTSAPQSVTMTNNGQTPLTITAVGTTGDFSETNNCPVSPASLAVNQSCVFQVTFTPTNTGTRSGSLVVTDNVTAGKSSVALSGTANPTFALISPTLTQVLPIGTASTTFAVSFAPSTPSTFTDVVSLACASGVTCTFSSGAIAQGQPTVPTSSTMTVSGLSTASSNPLFFTLNGTDTTNGGIGTASLTFTIYFGDFALSASPAVNQVVSGASTIYTVTVSPINNFSQPVVLSCLKSSLPQGALCTFSPAAITPSGGAGSSTLTISTTAQSTTTSKLLPRGHPRTPPGPLTFPLMWATCGLIMLITLLARFTSAGRATGKRRKLVFVHLALATLVLASAFWMSCDTEIYTNVIQPSTVNGTPTGNYKILVLGTYNGSTGGVGVTTGTSTSVVHQTTVNLTVQ